MDVDAMLRWTDALHRDRIGLPGLRDALTATPRLANGERGALALGVAVGEWRGVREVASRGSAGGFRTHLAHYPDYTLSVAVACNTSTADAGSLGRAVAAFFLRDRLQPEMIQRLQIVAAPRYFVAPEALGAMRGRYSDAETGAVVELAARDSSVMFRAGVHWHVNLLPVAEDSLAGGGVAIRIVRTPDGKPSGFYLHTGFARHIRFDRLPPP
jgi:hypothetical protein